MEVNGILRQKGYNSLFILNGWTKVRKLWDIQNIKKETCVRNKKWNFKDVNPIIVSYWLNKTVTFNAQFIVSMTQKITISTIERRTTRVGCCFFNVTVSFLSLSLCFGFSSFLRLSLFISACEPMAQLKIQFHFV